MLFAGSQKGKRGIRRDGGSGTIFMPCPLFMMEKQPAKFHTSNPREQACLPSDAIRRA